MKAIRVPKAMLDTLLHMEKEYWENRRRPLMRKAHYVTDGHRTEWITAAVWRKAFPRVRSQFGRTAHQF